MIKVICPSGHDSANADYCDVCGILMAAGDRGGASSPVPSVPTIDPTAAPVTTVVAPEVSADEACPGCGAVKSGQFCESCGFNFTTGTPAVVAPSPVPAPSSPAPSAPAPSVPAPSVPAAGVAAGAPVPGPDRLAVAWTAIVTADRAYYDAMRAAGGLEAGEIPFPAYCPERRFRLSGREVQIGRRSPSRGLDPEIDLTGPPLDPGVSRLQAVLMALPEGGWAVIDPGSANGTQVNDADIPSGQQIPLNDGDRISIGAWTTITIRAD